MPPGNGPRREQRIAAESGVDAGRHVAGTGKDGRVTKGDVLAAIAPARLLRPRRRRRARAAGARAVRRPTMPRAKSACA